jgi:hypothetical protein
MRSIGGAGPPIPSDLLKGIVSKRPNAPHRSRPLQPPADGPHNGIDALPRRAARPANCGRSVMPCSSVCNGGPDNTLGRFHPSTMSHMSISASLPSAAPWRNLSWGLFLPLVFAGNVVMATLAWIIVGWITG